MKLFCGEIYKVIPDNEDVVIVGDMDGHVGSERRRYKRIHRCYGFERKIETG